MKKLALLLAMLFSMQLFAQGKTPNNTFGIGLKSSSDDKGIIFESGDGAANKSLKMRDADKVMQYDGNGISVGDGSAGDKLYIFNNAAGTKPSLGVDFNSDILKYNKPNMSIGDGTDQDTSYVYDIGLGANNPKVKWSTAKQKFRQEIAGVEKDLGTGGGGGGGENFNNAFTADDNANAEDGLTGWTASAGTFALETADPLEGDQSFLWTPAAQNDTLDGPVLDVDKDIFLGRSCQVQIEYIGGDENLTLQVIDADNDIIGYQVLQVHTISAPESAFFICPNSAATANDKDLRLRILNEGASASAIIKFDKSYVGTNQGLSESALPDMLSFTSDSSGTIEAKNTDWISSCVESPTGTYTCDISSAGISFAPSCSAAVNAANVNVGYLRTSSSNTSLVFSMVVTSTAAATSGRFSALCSKIGSDAKQSVQVYKSIPTASQNANQYTIKINTGGVIASDDFNIISSDCAVSGTANTIKTCTFNSGIFTEYPLAVSSMCNTTGTTSRNSSVSNLTSSGFVVTTRNLLNDAVDIPSCITFYKKGADLELPTVQPIIVGQLVNSYSELGNNIRTESCSVIHSGTPVIDPLSSLCETWVGSITDSATGQSTINFIASIFSKQPVCVATAVATGRNVMVVESLASVFIRTTNSAGADTDVGYSITCTGVR